MTGTPSSETWRPDAASRRADAHMAEGATPHVTEVELNDSSGVAQVISRQAFVVAPNPNLPNAGLPSVTIVGSISAPNDTDFFSITLRAGELLILDVDNSGGNLDTMVRLYSANITNELVSNDDLGVLDPGSEPHAYGHNTDSFIRFRAPAEGIYYFSIEAFQDPEHPTSGSYELNVSVGPPATPAEIHDENIQALVSGRAWQGTNVTYGFTTSASQYESGEATDEIAGGFSSLNTTQINAVQRVLSTVSALTQVTFSQPGDPGAAQMRYALSGDPETAHAYTPGTGRGGDSWYNSTKYNAPTVGNYAFITFLHETGHALGLKHGHEAPALSPDRDSMEYSVMTYRGFIGAPVGEDDGGYRNESFGFAQTFMMYDIAALQRMYGANYNTNAGDTVYSWDQNTGAFKANGIVQHAPGANRVFMTVWDGGGSDTYDLSNYNEGVSINLNPGEWTTTSAVQLANLGTGHFARGNIANAFLHQGDARSLIENAIGGAGNDTITGNEASNRIDLSRGGIDTVFGSGGNDGIIFGAAFTADDKVDGGAGENDQVALQGDYSAGLTLGAQSLVNVETLLVLPGFDYRITAIDLNVPAGGRLQVFGTTLGAGDNLSFDGSAETNGYFVVYGGGGIDTVTGGAGNDGFYFGPGNFTGQDVLHGGAGNNDQLGLDGDYSLTLGGNFDGIETLVLYRGPDSDLNSFNLVTADAVVTAGQRFTVFGTTVATDLVFNGSAETDGSFRILGAQGNDTLSGGARDDLIFGGRGGDALNGGGGNDVFVYNNAAESSAASFDRILGFNAGDRIDLSGIDANGNTPENDGFALIGPEAFSGTAGQLRLFQANGGWTIEGDSNGDSIADLLINLTTEGGHIMAAGDFMF